MRSPRASPRRRASPGGPPGGHPRGSWSNPAAPRGAGEPSPTGASSSRTRRRCSSGDSSSRAPVRRSPTSAPRPGPRPRTSPSSWRTVAACSPSTESPRASRASVEPVEGAVETQVPRFGGACDGVLVDAPCSNLGVLRRNPDAKWRRGATDLALNAERQARILEAAAALVKPGGRLVYATCSLEPEENEDVARGFLAAHPEFRPDPPGEFPLPLDPDGTLRCLPHHHGTDGFTAVRFRRSLTRGITAP